VVLLPGLDRRVRFAEIPEPVFVQTLVPHLAFEALDESVPDWLPWLDETQLHTSLVSLEVLRLARKFRPVIRHQHFR
jgi:hypothetical protein